MTLFSPKAVLAVAAVVDIAVNGGSRPVSARALAARHKLPPRHLEPVLQALVRNGVLKGIRGPQGGYQLGRPRDAITAEDILRTINAADETADTPPSALLREVVQPALAGAIRAFSAALATVRVGDMARRADGLKKPD